MDRRILQMRSRTENKSRRLKSLYHYFHKTLNFLEFNLLHKILSATRLAIADRVVIKLTNGVAIIELKKNNKNKIKLTNTELLAASTRKKKQRVQRTSLQYGGQRARGLSPEDVRKRKSFM